MSRNTKKRPRRLFTKEYKSEVVRLVKDSGRAVGEVAEELGLSHSAVRQWVKQASIDEGQGCPGALTTTEREELGQLRREVRTLRQERDVLKRATAFFVKEGTK